MINIISNGFQNYLWEQKDKIKQNIIRPIIITLIVILICIYSWSLT